HVPCGLVEKQARCVDVLAERSALEILDQAGSRIGRARTESSLVLDRRAPGAQVDACRQRPRRLRDAALAQPRTHRILSPHRLQPGGSLIYLWREIAEIGIVSQPPHLLRFASSCAFISHGMPPRLCNPIDPGAVARTAP